MRKHSIKKTIIEKIQDNDLVFGMGPAGTGKNVFSCRYRLWRYLRKTSFVKSF